LETPKPSFHLFCSDGVPLNEPGNLLIEDNVIVSGVLFSKSTSFNPWSMKKVGLLLLADDPPVNCSIGDPNPCPERKLAEGGCLYAMAAKDRLNPFCTGQPLKR
jgi:hypothetical protein